MSHYSIGQTRKCLKPLPLAPATGGRFSFPWKSCASFRPTSPYSNDVDVVTTTTTLKATFKQWVCDAGGSCDIEGHGSDSIHFLRKLTRKPSTHALGVLAVCHDLFHSQPPRSAKCVGRDDPRKEALHPCGEWKPFVLRTGERKKLPLLHINSSANPLRRRFPLSFFGCDPPATIAMPTTPTPRMPTPPTPTLACSCWATISTTTPSLSSSASSVAAPS